VDLLNWSKKQTGWFFIGAYILAIAIGLITYQWLKDGFESVVLLTLMANIVMTFVIYLISLLTKNASMYDPYWSVIPPVILIWWMIDLKVELNLSIVLLLIGMLIWSIRLTYNWWKNWTGFKEQDWRYDLIEEKTKGYFFLSNFVAIHLIPTLVVYLQLINVYHILKLASSLNVFVVIGFMFMVMAAGLQFVADKQMFDFRQQRTDKSQCIDQGLWRYSRHPNYLGELTFWVGVYLIYLGAVQVIDFNIIYPLAMIALFLFISIPMMEKKLSDRPGYQTYKKKVSMLFPYRKVK
jgi:steroid 5-alpha reductase family enzyme